MTTNPHCGRNDCTDDFPHQHMGIVGRPGADRDANLVDDRHDADGKAYIAYFRADVTLGFIWDGEPDSLVQVTREMGEPVIAMFPASAMFPVSRHDLLATFREACDSWVENRGWEFPS